jgi:hypothetical protein
MKTPQKRFTVGNIYTNRYVSGYDTPSWHLVHEWEDQIAEAVPLRLDGSGMRRRLHEGAVARTALKVPGAFTILKAIDTLVGRPAKSLYFMMSPQRTSSFFALAAVIPIVVDFWKTVDLRWFSRTYSNCSLVLISSLEALNFLKSEGCPLNLRHFPLSLPDKYSAVADASYEKRYDIVIAGRSNPVLLDFVRRYEKDHPNVEYLVQSSHDDKLCYVSNKSGMVGAFEDRGSYMNLLRASKVGFYATPGLDGGEKRTGGFNPVTPRFFELLAAQCQVIARYPDNDDTRFFQMNELCPSVDTYDAFEAALTAALRGAPPMERHREYLQNHYTSARIDLLNRIVSSQN